MQTGWTQLRTLRKQRGLSIGRLGLAAAVARGHVCDLENGKRPANRRVATKLAAALGVTPQELAPELFDDAAVAS